MKGKLKFLVVVCLLALTCFITNTKAAYTARETSTVVYKIKYAECKKSYDMWDKNDNPQYYTKGMSGEKLLKVKREGYTFEGWYSDLNCTKKVTKISGSGDKTYYAKFTPIKFTIKFNANGGKGTMASKTVTYDSSTKLPKNTFKKSGKVFVEWNTKKDGTGFSCLDASVCTWLATKSGKTVTLYAIWGNKLTVKLNYTLSKNDPDYYYIKNYVLRKSYNPKEDTYLEDLYRKDYVFLGWYTDKSFKNEIQTIKKGTTGPVTIYAKWAKYNKKSNSQALALAKRYVKFDNVSKRDVKSYLTYKGYTKTAIDYALKNCNANWTKEAKDFAKNSVTYYFSSKEGLKTNLKNSGFTTKQINSAMSYVEKTLKVNWNNIALEKANSILKWSYLSKADLKNQLVFYSFTEKEANYAIKKVVSANKNIWKENAVKRIPEIMRYSKYSKSGLKTALISYYNFTEAEAKYALGKVTYDWTKIAVDVALDTLYNYPYSYKTIKDELKAKGFLTAERTDALAKINLEYKYNAVAQANQIVDKYYSKTKLINDLVNDYGFTTTEATYGANNCNVNLQEKAVNLAKELFNNYNRSRNELINYLTKSFYGLTEKEAIYAVDHAGIDFATYYKSLVANYRDNGFGDEDIKNKLVNNDNLTEEEALAALAD